MNDPATKPVNVGDGIIAQNEQEEEIDGNDGTDDVVSQTIEAHVPVQDYEDDETLTMTVNAKVNQELVTEGHLTQPFHEEESSSMEVTLA